jgi:hypothetical protein
MTSIYVVFGNILPGIPSENPIALHTDLAQNASEVPQRLHKYDHMVCKYLETTFLALRAKRLSIIPYSYPTIKANSI